MEKEKQKIVVQKKKYVPKEKPLKQEDPIISSEETQEEDSENLELITEIAKEAEKELQQEVLEETLLGEEIQQQAEKLLELEKTPIQEIEEPLVVSPVEEQPVEMEFKPAEESEPTFVRIVQKAPARYRLLFSDGSTKWVLKKDFNF